MGKVIVNDLDTNTERLAENIKGIIRHIDKNIIGRLANKAGDVVLNNVNVLLEFVSMAGGDNHLEIGTLFGGSAIAVALLKKKLFQNGIVVCVDPLDGYYRKYAPRDDMIDGVSGVPVTLETFIRNINLFNVEDRIQIIQAYSQPCIDFDLSFSTAYIDGDHRDGIPLLDWLCIKDRVSEYVIFDNWDNKHPDVQKACDVANSDFEWKCVYSDGITYVVKRI